MSILKQLHRQARSRRQGKPAFTLLELIVVLLVLGILAAIAVPTFNRVKENSVERVAQSTLEAIDRNGESIALSDPDLSDEQIAAAALDEVDAPAGMTITRDGTTVTVSNSNGSITASGTVTFSGGVGTIVPASVGAGGGAGSTTTVAPTTTTVPLPTLSLSYATTRVDSGVSSASLSPTVSGGTGSYSYTFDGSLPSGVSFDSATGEFAFSGTRPIAFTAISGGAYHMCGITPGQTVKCWGANWSGQLGDGTASGSDRTDGALVGESVPGVSGVVEVVTGGEHSCVRTSSGDVWCWGENGRGQLGTGTTIDSFVPVQVSLSGAASKIVSGENTVCALVGGGVSCWGSGQYGNLGNGATSNSAVPVTPTGLSSGVVDIHAGKFFACAETATEVACWGDNYGGQFANGARITSSPYGSLSPVSTSIPLDIVDFHGANNHACALSSSGGVSCWGGTDFVGTGGASGTFTYTPTTPTGLGSGVVAIGGGYNHTCAVLTSGTARCWGQNTWGELASGDGVSQGEPVDVAGLSGVTGVDGGEDHTCFTTSSSVTYCSGYDSGWGVVGSATAGLEPEMGELGAVAGLGSGVLDVAIGDYASCAVTAAGAVKCWGSADGTYGSYNLGYGEDVGRYFSSNTPRQVVGLESGAVAVDVHRWGGCAVLATGGVKCWGHGTAGQLGNDTFSDAGRSYSAVSVLGMSDAADVYVGSSTACVRTTSGAAYCWGYNGEGELGDGTQTRRTTPTLVSGFTSGVTHIAPDSNGMSCAVRNGAAYCWGWNPDSRLGVPTATTSRSTTPVLVNGLSADTVTKVTINGYGGCALTAAGAVKCWGGSQGFEDSNPGVSTLRSTSLTNIDHVSSRRFMNDSTACWVSSTGSVVCGTTTITGLPAVPSEISSGERGACALISGTAYCWALRVMARPELGLGYQSAFFDPQAVLSTGAASGFPITGTVTVVSGSLSEEYAISIVLG